MEFSNGRLFGETDDVAGVT